MPTIIQKPLVFLCFLMVSAVCAFSGAHAAPSRTIEVVITGELSNSSALYRRVPDKRTMLSRANFATLVPVKILGQKITYQLFYTRTGIDRWRVSLARRSVNGSLLFQTASWLVFAGGKEVGGTQLRTSLRTKGASVLLKLRFVNFTQTELSSEVFISQLKGSEA